MIEQFYPASSASLRVAVLAGGDSSERAVSLRSGRAVLAALAQARHRPILLDPAETPLAAMPWIDFDVCFVALHGGAGEDGRVQQQLVELDMSYTGSGPEASHLAMSKSATKRAWRRAGLPTKPYVAFDAALPVARIARRVEPLGWPLVVKPDAEGSSLGVTIVERPDQLGPAIDVCRSYQSGALAESLIVGREFTVALLGRRALPLLEIVKPESVFSYEAKYSSPATRYRFDTGLTAMKTQRLQELAVAAAAIAGTDGLARVDLMLDRAGAPWLLEINAVPGLTERSLAPLAAARAGIDMPRLCDWAIRDAIARQCSRHTPCAVASAHGASAKTAAIENSATTDKATAHGVCLLHSADPRCLPDTWEACS